MANTHDEQYILRLKGLNWTDDRIGEKMGIPSSEVTRIWKELLSRTQNQIATGYVQLADFYNNLANQYKLLGESLNVLAQAVGNQASSETLKTFLNSHQIETLLNNYIVLNKFVPPTPSDSLPTDKNKN